MNQYGIMPALLLQPKERLEVLTKRLLLWTEGILFELLHES